MNVVREVGYASAYTFKYSIRPGTPGATTSATALAEAKVEGIYGGRRRLSLLRVRGVQK